MFKNLVVQGFDSSSSIKEDYKDPTLDDLNLLEKSLFGDQKSVPEEELVWWEIGPDNFMINALKRAVTISTHTLEKQIKQVEKDIKKAQKVFFS